MLLAVAAALTIEQAFPPTIAVHGGLYVELELERGETTWLTIRLASPRADTIQIDLPAGTHVFGMELDRDDASVWAAVLPIGRAEREFREVTGPAIATWDGTSGGEDHLVVRVDRGARSISLALDLPAMPNLRLEPAQLARVDGKPVKGPIAIAAHDALGYPHVDADHSLLATPNAISRNVIIDTMSVAIWHESVDSRTIRKVVKAHIPELTHCYTQVAQAHPDLEGKLELHFAIGPDGRVRSARIDGDLASDQVRACFVAAAGEWEFPAFDDEGGITEVNYPFQLRLNR